MTEKMIKKNAKKMILDFMNGKIFLSPEGEQRLYKMIRER